MKNSFARHLPATCLRQMHCINVGPMAEDRIRSAWTVKHDKTFKKKSEPTDRSWLQTLRQYSMCINQTLLIILACDIVKAVE